MVIPLTNLWQGERHSTNTSPHPDSLMAAASRPDAVDQCVDTHAVNGNAGGDGVAGEGLGAKGKGSQVGQPQFDELAFLSVVAAVGQLAEEGGVPVLAIHNERTASVAQLQAMARIINQCAGNLQEALRFQVVLNHCLVTRHPPRT